MPPADLATKPAYKSGISRKKRQPAQRTSPNGLVAGSQLYSTVRPRQFIVVPLVLPPKKPERAARTHHLTRQPLLQKTPLPRCRLPPQPHPAKDSGDWAQRPSRPTFRSATENGQSALSSWHLCPAPSVSTPTGRDCLAATPPRLARDLHHALTRLLLRPHSQTSAFDTYPTKGTHRRPSRRLKSFLR